MTCKAPVKNQPGLTVDAGTVKKSRHQILSGAEAAEHQADPVHSSQHKHTKGQQETAVIRLSNTAVYPAAPQHTQTHMSRSTTSSATSLFAQKCMCKSYFLFRVIYYI